METDRLIALYVSEKKLQEKLEKVRAVREQYDPKKRIAYTLEELIEGIKKEKLYLYTLKLCFVSRQIFEGAFCIPFMTDFFDVVQETPQNLLYASNLRKVCMVIGWMPATQAEAFSEWTAKLRETVEQTGLKMNLPVSHTVGELEYMTYEMPSDQGLTYNILFRLLKDGNLYTGSLNCMQEEKNGMGLLLEAMVHVTEEMNR